MNPAEQGDGVRADVEGLAAWLDGLGGAAAARKGYAEAAAALRSITETNRVQAAEIERLQPYHDELLKIAEQVGEPDDPFAAWETIAALQDGRVDADVERIARAHYIAQGDTEWGREYFADRWDNVICGTIERDRCIDTMRAALSDAILAAARKWEDVDVERLTKALEPVLDAEVVGTLDTTHSGNCQMLIKVWSSDLESARAALSAIGAPSGGGGWRPISDPPPLKDPCMVIWAYPDGSAYDGPEEAYFITRDSYMGVTNNLRRKGKGVNWPTHWAPKLPAPSPRSGEDESAPSEVKG